MHCMFLRRGVPQTTLPTLRELLLDMTLVADYSVNSSSTYRIYIPTSSAASGLYYLLSICDGYMGVWKIKDGTLSMAPVQRMSASYGGISLPGSGYYYHHTAAGATTTGTQINGASVLLVQFPNYSEAQIDAVLGAMTLTRVAGRNESSTGYVRTKSDKGHDFYLTTRYKKNGSSYTGYGTATGLVLWESDGSTWTMLNQVTPNWQAGAVSNGYLTLGAGTYGASIIAMDE